MQFARTTLLQWAQLALTTALVVLGCWLGSKFYGTIGCLVGVVMGIALGNIVNRLTGGLFVSFLQRDLKSESEDGLRKMAHDDDLDDIRLLAIKELIAAGADIDSELPLLYREAASDCLISRGCAWSALRELYSDRVHWIEDFDEMLSSPEECRNRVELLRTASKPDGGFAAE